MTILDTIVLSFIEGITEFLPVSSTGHLIVVGSWLGVAQNETNKAIEVVIQFASILAVIANYKSKFTLKHLELWKKTALAFLPIGIIGFLFHHQIKMLFSVPVVASMFILGGIAFLVLEHFYKEQNSHVTDLETLSYKQALWIGIAQVSALIPGTSRAGASIVGALLVGLNRKVSAEFSFLLALPVLGAAAGLDLISHYKDFSHDDLQTLLIGFGLSFVVAFVTIRLFLGFLEHFTFRLFGLYRIAFGLLLLWLS